MAGTQLESGVWSVKLEPKGQIGNLCAPRESSKPGVTASGAPAMVSLWEKGSSQSEGDLVRCASWPRSGATALGTGGEAPC